MASISETCSVCGSPFEPQFRYQMEEVRGGFSFYCSQDCLKRSHRSGGEGFATCDACAKTFTIELVSSVFYLAGRRRYACSMDCRTQLTREASGVRLGQIAAAEPPPLPEPAVPPSPAASPPQALPRAPEEQPPRDT